MSGRGDNIHKRSDGRWEVDTSKPEMLKEKQSMHPFMQKPMQK